MYAARTLPTLVLATILLTGCKRDEDVVTYNAPKPPEPRASATQEAVASASALSPQPAPEIPGLNYAAPTGWVPLQPHQFEAARFDPGVGDRLTAFTISPMGPKFDYPSNLDRWQKQVGAAPTTVPDGQPGPSKDVRTVGGAQATVFDLKGSKGESFIVVAQRPDVSWVFKLTGPADKVQAAMPAVEAFLQSVKFGESAPTAAAALPLPQTPPAPAQPTAADLPFTYTAPADWQLDPQPHSMREVTWTVGSGASKVEAYITEPIATDRFDIPANVNRWRDQVGLPPDANVSANPTADVTIGNQRGVMLDLTGPAQAGKPARRMLVAFAGKQQLWFFKVIGPADAVGQQKSAFEKFLGSVKFKPGAR